MKRIIVLILLILNVVVLMGQAYPAGVPPFARTVNILFLILNLGFLVYYNRKK